MYGERKSFVPVKIGDELNVKIEAVGEKGDGVAKINGFVLFVPNGKQGDTVKVKITKVLSKMGFAEIVGKADAGSVQERSKRVNPQDLPDQQPIEYAEDSEDFGED